MCLTQILKSHSRFQITQTTRCQFPEKETISLVVYAINFHVSSARSRQNLHELKSLCFINLNFHQNQQCANLLTNKLIVIHILLKYIAESIYNQLPSTHTHTQIYNINDLFRRFPVKNLKKYFLLVGLQELGRISVKKLVLFRFRVYTCLQVVH